VRRWRAHAREHAGPPPWGHICSVQEPEYHYCGPLALGSHLQFAGAGVPLLQTADVTPTVPGGGCERFAFSGMSAVSHGYRSSTNTSARTRVCRHACFPPIFLSSKSMTTAAATQMSGPACRETATQNHVHPQWPTAVTRTPARVSAVLACVRSITHRSVICVGRSERGTGHAQKPAHGGGGLIFAGASAAEGSHLQSAEAGVPLLQTADVTPGGGTRSEHASPPGPVRSFRSV
jgi:hypothetical protein